MSLETIPLQEVEKGLRFLENGLPEGAKPISGGQFRGYYDLIRELGDKKIKLVYEPTSTKGYSLRNTIVLQ